MTSRAQDRMYALMQEDAISTHRLEQLTNGDLVSTTRPGGRKRAWELTGLCWAAVARWDSISVAWNRKERRDL